MNTRVPRALMLVALLQFIPPVIAPPSLLASISPAIWVGYGGLFALLGIYLMRRRGWSRVASIFVQGFSILVRLLTTVGHAVQGNKVGGSLDWWIIGTALLSALLSGMVLYYVDTPEVQVLMQ